ncbi:MAG: hypothetical protein WCF36_05745 [Candidatus Nanopelagicales bacterium]
MTAITTDLHTGIDLRVTDYTRAHDRLVGLLGDRRGVITWWIDLTRQLDELADAIRTTAGNLVDPDGFTEQIRDDAPHLMGRWLRLSAERDDLDRAVTDVRILAGSSAGDPTAVDTVITAVRDVLNRARRYQERTTDVLLDAYERDLGGE